MDVHRKLLTQMEKAMDSSQFRPAGLAALFPQTDYRTKVMWIGLIAETIFYIQANEPGYGIPPKAKEFIDGLTKEDLGHLYATTNW